MIAETALFPILPKIPSNNLPDAEEKEGNNQTELVSKAYIEELHIQRNYFKQENTYLRNQWLVLGENAATSLEEYDKGVNDLQSFADEAEKNFDAILSANRNKLEQLQQQLTEIEETYFETQLSLDEAESKVKKYCARNVRRREKDHKEKVKELKTKIKQYNKQIDQENVELVKQTEYLEKERNDILQKYNSENEKVDKLVKSKAYLKGQLKEKNEKIKSKEEIDRQWLRIRHLGQSNKDLQQILDLCEQNEIQIFQDGKYLLPIREVVINLVKTNIGHKNIVPAIKVVIEKVTPHSIDQLPSFRTINKMVHEAKCLALIQAGKAMLSDKDSKVPANILMEDATSKRRKTYNAVVISISEGLKNVSLPSLAKEDAETLVGIARDTFYEIANVMGRLERQKSEADLLKELYSFVKGTMSDSHEVMKNSY